DRGADFGREVREGGDVVADEGGRVGELRAGQLHAVAGVAGEADGDRFNFLSGGVAWGGLRLDGRTGRRGHDRSSSEPVTGEGMHKGAWPTTSNCRPGR